MSYHVTATRWERGWELHIDDVGVTQSHSLSGAEQMVRSYLAMDDYADADTAEITITPDLGDVLTDKIEAARESTRKAADLQRHAAEEQRRAVRDLKAAGLSGADMSAVLGVSAQRVSQLAKS